MLEQLRRAYDTDAAARDRRPKSAWKLAERAADGARRLLEVGAGTGQDSRYFQEQGFDVVALPRFFSMRTNEQIQRYATDVFDLVDFHTLDVEGGFRLQSVTLRRPAPVN